MKIKNETSGLMVDAVACTNCGAATYANWARNGGVWYGWCETCETCGTEERVWRCGEHTGEGWAEREGEVA